MGEIPPSSPDIRASPNHATVAVGKPCGGRSAHPRSYKMREGPRSSFSSSPSLWKSRCRPAWRWCVFVGYVDASPRASPRPGKPNRPTQGRVLVLFDAGLTVGSLRWVPLGRGCCWNTRHGS
jgi:hypothetical protein